MRYFIPLVAISFLNISFSAWGQTEIKIMADDAAIGDSFSWVGVSVDADTTVIGAFGNDDDGTDSGSAYVFSRNQGGPENWGQVRKLTADDAAEDDRFGFSVSVDGDTAVVGAYRDDDGGMNSGSAYVFLRNLGGAENWGQFIKLVAADPGETDRFGYAVALDADTAVIGSSWDDDDGTDSGSAYVFSRNQGGVDNWGQVMKLTADDASAGDRFGATVSVDGDTALIGAFADDGNTGSAYVFSRNQGGVANWGQVAKLTAEDAALGDLFGVYVSVDGDTAIVGAPFDDDDAAESGSAYVFSRNQGGTDNWGQVLKLTAPDPMAGVGFGWSASLSSDIAVVGRYNDDEGGSAYVFSRNEGGPDNWGQVVKLTASDAAPSDSFGFSVAVDGLTAVIGAVGDDDGGTDSGSAYVMYGLDILLKSGFGPADLD